MLFQFREKLEWRRSWAFSSSLVVFLILISFAAICVTANEPVKNVVQESEVSVRSIGGETISGQIQSIAYEKIAVKTDAGVKELNFENVEWVDFGNEVVPSEEILAKTQIQLVDGSNFRTDSFEIKSNSLETQLPSGAKIAVNTRNVEWVRFKSFENDLALAKSWRQILEDKSREGDSIVVARSGELDTVEGIVGDFVENKLEFSIGERTARVAMAKLNAILFFHVSELGLGSATCDLKLIDGSHIRLKTIGLDNGELVATAVCGAEFRISNEYLGRLNFSRGRSVFLSSMKPTTNDWQPLLTSSAIFEKLRKMKLARVGESFSGQPLSLNFQSETSNSAVELRQYEHGFAIQSGGKLAFSLGGQYQELSGLVGFDPNISAGGNVRLKVLVDGKAVVDQVLIRESLRNPFELDLNVEQANRVVFQIEYNDGRSVGDQVHLCDLKVSQ